MKYIIELPEDYYKAIKEIPIKQSTTDMLIIRNGTPLSEELENQKTGHWIEMNANPDGTHNIYCSNCNIYQKFKGHANSYNARTKLKYCPNCGAKMEGK